MILLICTAFREPVDSSRSQTMMGEEATKDHRQNHLVDQTIPDGQADRPMSNSNSEMTIPSPAEGPEGSSWWLPSCPGCPFALSCDGASSDFECGR